MAPAFCFKHKWRVNVKKAHIVATNITVWFRLFLYFGFKWYLHLISFFTLQTFRQVHCNIFLCFIDFTYTFWNRWLYFFPSQSVRNFPSTSNLCGPLRQGVHWRGGGPLWQPRAARKNLRYGDIIAMQSERARISGESSRQKVVTPKQIGSGYTANGFQDRGKSCCR